VQFFVSRVEFNTKDTKDTKVRILGLSLVSFVSLVLAGRWNPLGATEKRR